MQARGVFGGEAAEVEAVAHRGELGAVGDEEVERGADRDAELLARIADDLEAALDGLGELVGARMALRDSGWCPADVPWRGLLVRDLRKVRDGGEVADACAEHLRMATAAV